MKLLPQKSIVLPVLLLVAGILLTCEKKEERRIRLNNMTTVECDASESFESNVPLPPDTDSVKYVIDGTTLTIRAGFYGNCCSVFITSSTFVSDTIWIEIREWKAGTCNCICYYTAGLEYTGFDKDYFYRVDFPDGNVKRGVMNVE